MKVDDVEIAKQQAIRRQPLSEHQKSLLIDAGYSDFVKGGKTASPLGDLAILGATAAAVKGAPLMIGKLGGAAKSLLKNEVAKMTVSDAAFKKGLLPQLTKSGIKNWQHLRPWNAFSRKMLATGPTPAAAAASSLLIEGAGAPPAVAGIPSGGWTIGGKKKTGMGSLTPEAVEDLIKNNPGAAEKIRKLYKEQQGGTELFPGV